MNSNQIEDNLYLGSYSSIRTSNAEELKQRNITTILSVIETDIFEDNRIDGIAYHRISAEDSDCQDLLTSFPEAIEILANCHKSGGNAIVHSMAGVSRSATVVIAYIMARHRMPYSEAIRFVESKREVIYPNDGFRRQLKLFEEMDYTLDANNRHFRQFLVETYLIPNDSKNINYIKQYFDKLSAAENCTPNLALGQPYQCLKCEIKLFNEIHVLNNIGERDLPNASHNCKRIFVEPLKWMTKLRESDSEMNLDFGFMKCPNCYENKAVIHNRFESIVCNCRTHIGIKCLKIQILDETVKKPFNYCHIS